MTNPYIERPARAAAIYLGGASMHTGEAVECARAVLSAALNEPSEEMVEVAARAHCNFPIGSDVWESPITDRPYRLKIMRAALVAVGKLFEGRTG